MSSAVEALQQYSIRIIHFRVEPANRGKHYRPEQDSIYSTMTNLAPEVFCWSSSPSFSTTPLLTGLEFDPEEGERKAMNEFFLIVRSCLVVRCWLLIQIHVKNEYADHLDGLAEWDLCSGNVDEGDGSGEERVWPTWLFFLLFVAHLVVFFL